LIPRKSFSYEIEARYYKVSLVKRIKQLTSRYSIDSLEQIKLKFTEACGAKSIVFKRTLDSLLAKPGLTILFYKDLSLEKYSLEFLLTILSEVESANSVLSLYKLESSKSSSVTSDNLKLLQMIEKSFKKEVREDQKSALMAS